MKTLLTLFVLFLSSISLNSNAGIFDKTVCLETDAQIRLGNIYLPNSDKTFTGNILCEYENGQTKLKGKVKDGKIDGELFMWYENGQKKIEATFEGRGTYIAFLPSKRGAVSAWDVHGNPQSKGEFVIACFDFINTYYFNGNKINKIDMILEGNDKKLLTGKIYYHDNGMLFSEGWGALGLDWIHIYYYENGKQESQDEWSYPPEHPKGIALNQAWYENGQKMFQGQKNHDNDYIGTWTEWHDNGQKKSEIDFIDDEMTNEKQWDKNGQPAAKKYTE